MSTLSKLDVRELTAAFGRQRGSAILGLHWDGARLDGVVLRRTNGSVMPQKIFSVQLSLDPLTNAPELVGREIRNRLDAEGIRERRCILGLPLKWALVAHAKIPDLPDEDVESFLQIEAERGFPCDVSTLMTGSSRYAAPSGERFATFVGVPRNHVTLVESVLRAAQLRPAAFSLGVTALQPPGGSEGILALALGETQVALQITAGGGVVSLRALEGALEMEGGQRRLRPDFVAREIRITLAQLPADLRQTIKRVRIFGPRELAQQLADEIELRLEPMNFGVEVVTGYGAHDFAVHIPEATPVSPAVSLAARNLAGEAPVFQFLPPRISKWQSLTARYSAGRLQQAGIAAAAVALVVGGMFLFQEWQLHRLQSEWKSMQKQVTEVKDLQKKLTTFRPWTDESLRAMNILRRITECFPEDGSVTAKLLEVRNPGAVVCTGTARDYASLLRTVERLRAVPEIPDVRLGQTRGSSPALQFTFSFIWNQGGKDANQ